MKIAAYLFSLAVSLPTLSSFCYAVDSGTNADQEVSHPGGTSHTSEHAIFSRSGAEEGADLGEIAAIQTAIHLAFGNSNKQNVPQVTSPREELPLPKAEDPEFEEDQPSPSLETMTRSISHSPHPPSAEGSPSKAKDSGWEAHLFTDMRQDIHELKSDLRDRVL